MRVKLGVLRRMIREAATTGAIFFHATPTRNVPSILARGLVPTDVSPHEPGTSYPEPRTYLVNDESALDDLVDLIELTSGTWTRRWTILRINCDLVTHGDPEIPNDSRFCYTTQSVPASAIAVHDTFEF